jgi:hypothetical protein
MTAPRYQEARSDGIQELTRADGTRLRIIAGAVDGIVGAVTEIAADPVYLDVDVPPRTSTSLPCSAGHTAFAYVFEGAGVIGSTSVKNTSMAVLADGDTVEVKTEDSSVRFLLVSGKPLNEPVARYGPFVMNTRAEIEQALLDLREGTFVTT